MFGFMRKDKGENFADRSLLIGIYDNHHGVEITVNGTENDVVVPKIFKIETSLVLTISRSTVYKISFSDNLFIFTFKHDEFEYQIPYKQMRSIKPVTTRPPLSLDKKRNLYNFYSTMIGAFLSVFFVGGLFSVIYIYFNGMGGDVSVLGYSPWELSKSIWHANTSLVVSKVVAAFVFLMEIYVVLLLGMLFLVSNYFSYPSYVNEVIIFAVTILFYFLLYQLEKYRSPSEKAKIAMSLDALGLRPIFKKKVFNVKIDFCFYVGPFSSEYTQIYENHIKPVITSSGMKIKRADEIFSSRPVMDDIWEMMNEAAIVIAEISNRNPNVMYEIGMAHTIGKKVVIIAQNIKDIPFDLQHHRYILYDNTESGLRDLEHRIVNTVFSDIKPHLNALTEDRRRTEGENGKRNADR